MCPLVKMEIIGCSDDKFRKEVKKMKVQVNPDSLKYEKGIAYSDDKKQGVGENAVEFNKQDKTSLSFDILFDETGIIPDLPKNSIVEAVNMFEEIAYKINSDIHEPNYLKVSWGSFLFKGRMTSLSYDYSLFRPDGSPLRVKITARITGFMDPVTEAKQVGRKSPDLSRIIILRSGESIPYWCNEIYGDPSYCVDIAKYNHLPHFRQVMPGTKLIFPPLSRTGN